MSLWYVYVDWTQEESPRAFYVGKGNVGRVRCLAPSARNSIHQRITAKYGCHRTIVAETLDATEAYDIERFMIKTLKTYAHGGDGWWGANLDLGGPGGEMTPKTPEHRQKIRDFMRTRTGERNNFYGRQHTDDTKQRISEAMKGELGPCFGRTGRAHPMFGKKHSEAARKKMSAVHIGKQLSQEHINSIRAGHTRRNEARRERNRKIIKMFQEGISRQEIAAKLGIGINIVYGALYRWRRSESNA